MKFPIFATLLVSLLSADPIRAQTPCDTKEDCAETEFCGNGNCVKRGCEGYYAVVASQRTDTPIGELLCSDYMGSEPGQIYACTVGSNFTDGPRVLIKPNPAENPNVIVQPFQRECMAEFPDSPNETFYCLDNNGGGTVDEYLASVAYSNLNCSESPPLHVTIRIDRLDGLNVAPVRNETFEEEIFRSGYYVVVRQNGTETMEDAPMTTDEATNTTTTDVSSDPLLGMANETAVLAEEAPLEGLTDETAADPNMEMANETSAPTEGDMNMTATDAMDSAMNMTTPETPAEINVTMPSEGNVSESDIFGEFDDTWQDNTTMDGTATTVNDNVTSSVMRSGQKMVAPDPTMTDAEATTTNDTTLSADPLLGMMANETADGMAMNETAADPLMEMANDTAVALDPLMELANETAALMDGDMNNMTTTNATDAATNTSIHQLTGECRDCALTHGNITTDFSDSFKRSALRGGPKREEYFE